MSALVDSENGDLPSQSTSDAVGTADPGGTGDGYRDELPNDLDRGFVGAYQFPDNSRRRVTGVLYVELGIAALALWQFVGDDSVLVNAGTAAAGVLLCVFGIYSIAVGRRFAVDEHAALVAATAEAGFAVGHASAQLGWRGWLSRPVWRVLIYSAEDPPVSRGLVMVDALNGQVLECWIEDNPEDWIATAAPDASGPSGALPAVQASDRGSDASDHA